MCLRSSRRNSKEGQWWHNDVERKEASNGEEGRGEGDMEGVSKAEGGVVVPLTAACEDYTKKTKTRAMIHRNFGRCFHPLHEDVCLYQQSDTRGSNVVIGRESEATGNNTVIGQERESQISGHSGLQGGANWNEANSHNSSPKHNSCTSSSGDYVRISRRSCRLIGRNIPPIKINPPLSIACQMSARTYGVRIVDLSFRIDRRLTVIDERSLAVLKYRTPHFRAKAVVSVPPLRAGDAIQIGWIQVCTNMKFINSYGSEGITSWEFPEIGSGKFTMISDSDGKQYPWYGVRTEVKTLHGPTDSLSSVAINMNDNFFPQVTWYIPHRGYQRIPRLTNIYRKQHFYTFLALHDLNTANFHVLQTITWSMELAIDVNPSAPVGQRATLIGPFEQRPPRVLSEDEAVTCLLEKNAMNAPNANSSQVLVWRPRVGRPSLVVPPIETTCDIARYLVLTEDYRQRPKLLPTFRSSKFDGYLRSRL